MDDVSIAGADADAITRGYAFDRTGALATRLTTRDPVTPSGATSHPKQLMVMPRCRGERMSLELVGELFKNICRFLTLIRRECGF
jgi:hypothetical protein